MSQVSLATSVFVAGTVAHLIARNGPRDRGNAAFLGVFGSMQLVDALLWWEEQSGAGLDECSVFNRIITRLAIGIILLEPVGALIGTSMIAKKKPSPLEVCCCSCLTPSSVDVCVCVCLCLCLCVSVSVVSHYLLQRDRQREREREGESFCPESFSAHVFF